MPASASTLRRWSARTLRVAKRVCDEVRVGVGQLNPGIRARSAATAREREAAEDVFREIARSTTAHFDGTVLVDAMWDNPNYWYRLSLMRAALGTHQATEIGLTGPYRAREASATLQRLGIRACEAFDRAGGALASFRPAARRLLTATETPADILAWTLPESFPATVVFDGILKRQRAATVDLGHPLLEDHVAEALRAIASACCLVETYRPQLVLLSHAINFRDAAIAWVAQRAAISSVVLFGNYGVPRFWRIDRGQDLFDSVDRASGADLDALPPAHAEAMATIGRRYLDARLAGTTGDIGSRYAFQRNRGPVDRLSMARHFGWDPAKPVIAVYASNWFDFPHGLGMTHFVDFLDWLRATLDASIAADHVNWLFRAHPCDAWYGGVTLADLASDRPAPHVRLCLTEWNGAAVTAAADALVTYHGTAAIEYAAAGKPVLVADRGWYHDCGFVVLPESRAAYLAALGRRWWDGIDRAHARHRALLFAGSYFAHPAWQGGLLFPDDSEQARIYAAYPALLAAEQTPLAREIDAIGDWWRSGKRFLHTTKMMQASSFALPLSAA
jgi:hypothetical protein